MPKLNVAKHVKLNIFRKDINVYSLEVPKTVKTIIGLQEVDLPLSLLPKEVVEDLILDLTTNIMYDWRVNNETT